MVRGLTSRFQPVPCDRFRLAADRILTDSCFLAASCVFSAVRWRTEAFDRQTGSVPLQRSKSEQMWLIESSTQVNSPAAGGARTCGNGVDCVQDTLLSRWASILSMTALSSIAAITLAVPPQTRHLATSMLNTRLSLWAQVMATWRLVPASSVPFFCCGFPTALASPRWGDQGSMFAVGCELRRGTGSGSLWVWETERRAWQ